jgi:DNA-directed RNA polymerase specialized sigma24 family protein
MTTDGELMHDYAETRSEEAFTELVRRHLDLVYSAAIRQVNGDMHLAQDVAQVVFSDLARKAGSLAGRPVLTGWLYTSTHFAAAKAVRAERRRQAHEQDLNNYDGNQTQTRNCHCPHRRGRCSSMGDSTSSPKPPARKGRNLAASK